MKTNIRSLKEIQNEFKLHKINLYLYRAMLITVLTLGLYLNFSEALINILN